MPSSQERSIFEVTLKLTIKQKTSKIAAHSRKKDCKSTRSKVTIILPTSQSCILNRNIFVFDVDHIELIKSDIFTGCYFHNVKKYLKNDSTSIAHNI